MAPLRGHVAAIVDANIAAREDDISAAAALATSQKETAWKSFARICEDMDADGDGGITPDEFKALHSQRAERERTYLPLARETGCSLIFIWCFYLRLQRRYFVYRL